MRKLEERLQKHVDLLVKRYPTLKNIEQSIVDAYLVLEKCYENDGKLLIAGNGGSAADSEHIAGELMKKFKTPRPVKKEFAEKLIAIDPERGAQLANNLECSLMAIPLVAHEALTTAYINDVDGLTGAYGGELAKISDVAVKVPETETYMIQELHLPIYHCWCLMLEDKFFGV